MLYTWITLMISVTIGANLDRLEMERSLSGLERPFWPIRRKLSVGIMVTWQKCIHAVRLQGRVYQFVVALVLEMLAISVAGLWRSATIPKPLSGYQLAFVFANSPSSMWVKP